jgi:hypothetical protein
MARLQRASPTRPLPPTRRQFAQARGRWHTDSKLDAERALGHSQGALLPPRRPSGAAPAVF